MGGRSERNDHLLLHAFTERDYIVPERTMYSNHRTTVKNTQEVNRNKKNDYFIEKILFRFIMNLMKKLMKIIKKQQKLQQLHIPEVLF